MTVQAQVGQFLSQYGLGHSPQIHALDLASEVGEIAKALLEASDYGRAPLRDSAALGEELGDAFFSLLALAESLDLDLEEALRAALDKYERRLDRKGHTGSGPQTA